MKTAGPGPASSTSCWRQRGVCISARPGEGTSTGSYRKGGYVAMTGMDRDFRMVRLEGKAWKVPEQKKWIDRIFEENPVMNDVYPGDSRYILEPFCLDSGQMEFFDLGKSPVQRCSFALGEEVPREKG